MSLELKMQKEEKTQKMQQYINYSNNYNNYNNYNIEFIFNYTKQKIVLSLEYILLESNKYSKEIKTIIKEKCSKISIVLQEDNIILYDFENDYIIKNIDDLISNKTTKCAIMIIPIACNDHT